MTSTPPRMASHSAVNLDQIRRGKEVVVSARDGDGGAVGVAAWWRGVKKSVLIRLLLLLYCRFRPRVARKSEEKSKIE